MIEVLSKPGLLACRAPMISPMAEALISLPVEICLEDAVSANLETYWTTMCTMVLENRLMSVMRFKSGDVSPAAPARSPQPVHEPILKLTCCRVLSWAGQRCVSTCRMTLGPDVMQAQSMHVARFACKAVPLSTAVLKQDECNFFQCHEEQCSVELASLAYRTLHKHHDGDTACVRMCRCTECMSRALRARPRPQRWRSPSRTLASPSSAALPTRGASLRLPCQSSAISRQGLCSPCTGCFTLCRADGVLVSMLFRCAWPYHR